MPMGAESTSQTVYASAARTTAQTGLDIQVSCRSLVVTLDVTDVSASPTVTVTIQGKDVTSGKYRTLLAGAAVNTAVTNYYKVSPHLTAVANVTAQDVVPDVVRINVAVGGAQSCTYSVGLCQCM